MKTIINLLKVAIVGTITMCLFLGPTLLMQSCQQQSPSSQEKLDKEVKTLIDNATKPEVQEFEHEGHIYMIVKTENGFGTQYGDEHSVIHAAHCEHYNKNPH